RVRDRRLGRLVQQPAPPQLTGHDPPGRVRGAPLRGPQPRARPRKVAAENPGRISTTGTDRSHTENPTEGSKSPETSQTPPPPQTPHPTPTQTQNPPQSPPPLSYRASHPSKPP